MAMIQCPECGKEISDKAFTCPNCGVPINMEMPVKVTVQRTKAFFGGGVGIGVAIDGGFLGELGRGRGVDLELYPGRHLLELSQSGGALKGYSNNFEISEGANEVVITVAAGTLGPKVESYSER